VGKVAGVPNELVFGTAVWAAFNGRAPLFPKLITAVDFPLDSNPRKSEGMVAWRRESFSMRRRHLPQIVMHLFLLKGRINSMRILERPSKKQEDTVKCWFSGSSQGSMRRQSDKYYVVFVLGGGTVT
jgi:hypothetical protein